ncbi:hypothetical protein [Guptibacillus hwajinpoensis]|uniref:hypothetical protein n=1 Tax=Guptibacillus hwajinpoensis TaxID=208199 RepID=UPI001CFF2AFE|nr:hypothetical protein [Pseudalkalibacillus hwajinpoensis]WLR58708.1 hypothetical protein LC071_16265 [Pseudalkalibacillus hwajinpoensis]
MKHSVGTFTHRYSVVHHQTQVAIQHSKRLSKKKIDIRKLSQMTGFSEEQILESMEFGDPNVKVTRPTLPKQTLYLDV